MFIAFNKNPNTLCWLSICNGNIDKNQTDNNIGYKYLFNMFLKRYHKNIRSKGALSSLLDDIPGIGEKRKKTLLKKYSSMNKMKEASIDELKEILPDDIANNLYEFLTKDKAEKLIIWEI